MLVRHPEPPPVAKQPPAVALESALIPAAVACKGGHCCRTAGQAVAALLPAAGQAVACNRQRRLLMCHLCPLTAGADGPAVALSAASAAAVPQWPCRRSAVPASEEVALSEPLSPAAPALAALVAAELLPNSNLTSPVEAAVPAMTFLAGHCHRQKRRGGNLGDQCAQGPRGRACQIFWLLGGVAPPLSSLQPLLHL